MSLWSNVKAPSIRLQEKAAADIATPAAGEQREFIDSTTHRLCRKNSSNVVTDIEGGDVVSPASSTDNAIARFDGTTGKLLQNSAPLVQDDGRISTVTDPSSAQDVATKAYVDAIAINLGKRARVRAATTANITISTALNNGDSLDGLTLATGDLVLVKDQSAPAQNGIYVVGVSPARDAQFDTYDEHPGSLIAVEEGTANADTLWLCTSNAGGTISVTSIVFTQLSVTAGINQITGDVTAGPGSGSQAATIPNNTVTYAKIQDVSATDRLLMRDTAGAGDIEEGVVASGIEFSGAPGIRLTTQARTRQITMIIDGGGSVITTGCKGFVACPFTGTITGARLLSSDGSGPATSGSIVIDVWKDTYANYPPTVADTITASAKPTITTATKSDDTTLTGWTTSVTAGDVFGFNVDSVTSLIRVTLQLTIVLS